MANGNRSLAGLVLLLLLASLLPGQSRNAKIFGNIKNEAGDYLPGVQVTATAVESNAVTPTRSEGKKAVFRFLSLPPGLYELSFDLEGYQPLVLSGIRLNAEMSITLRVKLKKKE